MIMTKPFYKSRKITDLRDNIRQAAELYGDRPAFEIKNNNKEHYFVTYKEYQDDINCLGTALVDMGYKGCKIAVAAENRYEWCVTYHAVVNGTGVIVPIDKELLFEDINGILNAADVKLIFCDQYFAKKLQEYPEKLKKDLVIVQFPYRRGTAPEGTLLYTDLIAKGKELLANGDRKFLDAEINPEEMCSLLFTSGTTGASKGVMLCHRNFCSEVMLAMQVIKIYPEDCGISMLPLHHTYESTIILFFASYCGAKVTFCEGFKYVLQNMKEFNPSVFVSVPLLLETIHRKLYKAIAAKPHGMLMFKIGRTIQKLGSYVGLDFKKVFFKEIIDTFGGNMRLIICGAAPIDPQILKDFEAFGIQIIFGYGLTECAPLAICNHDRLHLAESIGVPLPEVECKIEHPDEDGNGEICVRGPMVMLGYYNNPEETANVIDKDGFLHTGDIGRVDKKGRFYISGRSKNVIVTSNGKNIFPEELEYHISRSKLVGECLVYGDNNAKGELVVKAKIFPNLEEVRPFLGKGLKDEITDEEVYEVFKGVIKEVNESVPSYKKITEFSINKTEFVKNTTMKIQRHKN